MSLGNALPGVVNGVPSGPAGDEARAHLPAAPAAGRAPVSLQISALDLSESPRLGGCDEAHIRTLAEADPDGLPPVLVLHPTMRVLDGIHRVHAVILRGASEISAELFHGTEEEGFVHAVRSNTTHGLPLSMEDRKAAALRILRDYPYCSDRSLSAVAGLSAKTIAALRRRSTAHEPQSNAARLGRDGRVRPASTADGRLLAGHLLRENPGVTLREVAQWAGISLGTAQDVSRRLRSGQDLIPAQQRGIAAAHRRLEVHGRTHDAEEGDTSPGTAPHTLSHGAPRSASPPGAVQHASAHSGTPRNGAPHGLAAPSLARLPFLRQDLSLRSTDAGRALLRLLIAQEAALDDIEQLANGVPAHCVPALSETASACMRLWAEFAESLARRERME
ncbi:hypothetical protein AB0D83_22105 [Streptomyces decoyicus]|uniref:hypothetical protein n=1 Tax=Streptomyces decoyicus TaxID=249567 RepID=UPI0033D254C4